MPDERKENKNPYQLLVEERLWLYEQACEASGMALDYAEAAWIIGGVVAARAVQGSPEPDVAYALSRLFTLTVASWWHWNAERDGQWSEDRRERERRAAFTNVLTAFGDYSGGVPPVVPELEAELEEAMAFDRQFVQDWNVTGDARPGVYGMILAEKAAAIMARKDVPRVAGLGLPISDAAEYLARRQASGQPAIAYSFNHVTSAQVACQQGFQAMVAALEELLPPDGPQGEAPDPVNR